MDKVACVWQKHIVPFSIVATTRSAYEGESKGGAEESRRIEMKAARMVGSVVLKMMALSVLQGADGLRYGSSSEEMGP